VKISISQLEDARANPTAFGQQLLTGGGKGFVSRGYFMDWRDAVLRWHKSQANPDVIRDELESILERRFTGRGNEKRRAETLETLDDYVLNFLNLGYRTVLTRERIDVTPSVVPPDTLQVTGEVPVIARQKTDYIAIILLNREVDWESEIRSPIIQSAIASLMNVRSSNVSIGAYCFSTKEYDERCFTDTETMGAEAEVTEVMRKVVRGMNGK